MRIAALTGWLLAAGVMVGGCFGGTSADTHADGGGFDGAFAEGGAEGGPDGGSVSLSTDPVDFGLVDCGGQPVTKSYSVENTGPAAITWSAAADAVFTVQGASSGTVAPGATATLTVAATIPATSTAGTAVAGTLTVTTDVPGHTTVKVPLKVTPQGGSITVTPSDVGFGTVSIGAPAGPLAFTLQNAGNAPVDVSLGAPGDPAFAITWAGAPAATTLAAGATLPGAGATFSPTAAGPKSATSPIQTKGAMCASPATVVSMSGTGTTSPVSVGPSPLDFQTTECGKTAAPQQVTIKNGSTAAINYTTALAAGASSLYSVDAPKGAVPAGGQVTLNVASAAIPVPGDIKADAYDDTLTVTTDAPGSQPAVVQLKQSAKGGILALAMTTTDFGPVQNTTATLPFTITNTGNEDVTVTPAIAGAGYAAALTSGSTVKAGGGTAPGNVTFTAMDDNKDTGTLSVTSSGALCAALPAAIGLTAQSQIPVAQTAATLSGSSTCGGGASSATLLVQNTGLAPLVIKSAASQGGLFSVGALPPAIAAGQGANLVVTIGAPPPGTRGGTSVNDALVFTTNEPTSGSHSVPVSIAVHGANLGFIDTSGATIKTLTVNACGVIYGVSNTGDLSATVIGASPYPATSLNSVNFGNGQAPATFTAPAGAVVTPGKPVGDVVRSFTFSGCPVSTSASFTNAAGDPVCVPLPTLAISVTDCACG